MKHICRSYVFSEGISTNPISLMLYCRFANAKQVSLCIILIGRSWRTWKTEPNNSTHIPVDLQTIGHRSIGEWNLHLFVENLTTHNRDFRINASCRITASHLDQRSVASSLMTIFTADVDCFKRTILRRHWHTIVQSKEPRDEHEAKKILEIFHSHINFKCQRNTIHAT